MEQSASGLDVEVNWSCIPRHWSCCFWVVQVSVSGLLWMGLCRPGLQLKSDARSGHLGGSPGGLGDAKCLLPSVTSPGCRQSGHSPPCSANILIGLSLCSLCKAALAQKRQMVLNRMARLWAMGYGRHHRSVELILCQFQFKVLVNA